MTKHVIKKKINFVVKFDIFSWNYQSKIMIKKGFTISIGCNLGKKNKSNHLFDPFTSVPIIGTKSNKMKDNKKIYIESLYKIFWLTYEKIKIMNNPINTKTKCLKKKK